MAIGDGSLRDWQEAGSVSTVRCEELELEKAEGLGKELEYQRCDFQWKSVQEHVRSRTIPAPVGAPVAPWLLICHPP